MKPIIVVLIIVFIFIVVFIGTDISSRIEDNIQKKLFWIFYLIAIITLANIGITYYYYDVIKDKRGPIGPKGETGDSGKRGDVALCDKDCRNKICYEKMYNYVVESVNDIAENPDPPIKVRNVYIKNKIKQMCHSNQYRIIEPLKGGSSNLINYLKSVWDNWIDLWYRAGGRTYFETTGAVEEWDWKDSNPFDEIEKYDVFYWGLPKEFMPKRVEKCNQPQIPNKYKKSKEDSQRVLKLIPSNNYDSVWHSEYTGRKEMNFWKPLHVTQDGEKYYPMGSISERNNRRNNNNKQRTGKFVIDKSTKVIKKKSCNGNRRHYPPATKTMLVSGKGTTGPERWQRVGLISKNATGNKKVYVWKPYPKAGYTCIGDYVTNSSKSPPIGNDSPIRCIPTKCVASVKSKKKRWISYDKSNKLSVTTFNKGGKVKALPSNGYNLFRSYRNTSPNLDNNIGQNEDKLYYIKEKCVINMKHEKEKEDEIRNYDTEKLGNGWDDKPKKGGKYSIFSFLELIKESLIINKETQRKYYISHTGKKDKNNSYNIRRYDPETDTYSKCLFAVDNKQVDMATFCNPSDKKQEWSIHFSSGDKKELYVKSEYNGKYLMFDIKSNDYMEQLTSSRNKYTTFIINKN